VISYPVNDAADCFRDDACVCACRSLHSKHLLFVRLSKPE
jgi:hypothetical protein